MIRFDGSVGGSLGAGRPPLGAAGLLLAWLAFVACEPQEPPAPPRDPDPVHAPTEPESPEEVWIPEPAPEPAQSGRSIRPAFAPDPDHDGDRPLTARRIVYRFELAVPPILGRGRPTAIPPVAELHVLATPDRLRAVFAGAGWPVPAESEVRVRRDRPGAYVFDGAGGRPLGPGQVAHWFEGGPPRRRVRIWMRVDDARSEADVGHMVCRFLGEWTSGSIDALIDRCDDGVPRWLRMGPYTAQRTADVEVEVPRRELRADHLDPPAPIEELHHKPYFSPAAMGRITPIPRPPARAVNQRQEPPEDLRGLRVHNDARTRLVVTADGTPLGWVDAGHSIDLEHLPEGVYMVGAMRPLGGLGASIRRVKVPGTVELPR